ncbi:MAG: diacylglycerol kinase [Halanaerobium sp.]|nr:diacylglycerol kinase [Halanaerobium sp.]
MKVRKLLESFNYAFAGIVYTLKTQRNMKVHFTIALLVLVVGLLTDISRVELILLMLTIVLVIITEMINTAVENVVDMITKEYHPLARVAKNVAAGAVLVTSANSILVGYFIFFHKIDRFTINLIRRIKTEPLHVVFISSVIIILLIVILKAALGRGTVFQGGIPSGHTMLAFSLATGLAFITENALVVTISFLLALLVGQSRVESGIHEFHEVFIGAVAGIVAAIFLYQLLL